MKSGDTIASAPTRLSLSLLRTSCTRATTRVAFLAAVVALFFALRQVTHGPALNTVLLTVGALHFTYDAVIWKLRRPALAKELELRPVAPAGTA